MKYKVIYSFYSSESLARKALKKIPHIFSNPRIIVFKNKSYGVMAGEYDRRDLALAAVHKLFESNLWGGILAEKEIENIVTVI